MSVSSDIRSLHPKRRAKRANAAQTLASSLTDLNAGLDLIENNARAIASAMGLVIPPATERTEATNG